jgi:hypothetical protein
MGTVNIPVQTPGAGQRFNMEQFLCWAMTALCKEDGAGFKSILFFVRFWRWSLWLHAKGINSLIGSWCKFWSTLRSFRVQKGKIDLPILFVLVITLEVEEA